WISRSSPRISLFYLRLRTGETTGLALPLAARGNQINPHRRFERISDLQYSKRLGTPCLCPNQSINGTLKAQTAADVTRLSLRRGNAPPMPRPNGSQEIQSYASK